MRYSEPAPGMSGKTSGKMAIAAMMSRYTYLSCGADVARSRADVAVMMFWHTHMLRHV